MTEQKYAITTIPTPVRNYRNLDEFQTKMAIEQLVAEFRANIQVTKWVEF